MDGRSGGWQFWIDRGGTFTDVVAVRPDGTLVTAKLLSDNPQAYPDAAVEGIRRVLGLAPGEPLPAAAMEVVKMGTTVATNALLERRGDPTALVITEGFADALRIGYQNRPRLFDRHIRLPEMLYETVIEAPERLAADGRVLTPLDLDTVRLGLARAFDAGIRSVAVVFVHGYRYPDHERAVAALAHEMGFTQVSVSHRVSPLMKLVSRGDTTVVDAYLSPILRRYVDGVAAQLGDVRLMFMQSNGGLTDAARFQGKDSILSGPAGGVVGMAQTAALAGFDRVIGFDMGGTSTDVSHFSGEYERSFETQVAGVRVRAPMMRIHTVAAGGGSILYFDGARYRVGPESAGADPGPACYRRGGPLTVTDCNVILGKIQPRFFPALFGPGADAPLDADATRQKFTALADDINRATGVAHSPEAVAEGFLKVAVENMASAIKRISVQRGYDVTEYTLNCFGGAGGQHACAVADALGMERVFIHPFAGVLSAYGMGLADLVVLREGAVEAPLDDRLMAELAGRFEALDRDARAELVGQGMADSDIQSVHYLHLRYEGTDTAFRIGVGAQGSVEDEFAIRHRGRFGFVMEGRGLIAEALSVVASAGGARIEEEESELRSTAPTPLAQVEMHSDGRTHETPLYDRAHLHAGATVDGPAIIIEANATTVVEPGWRTQVSGRNHLILTRAAPRPERVAVGTRVDPVMLEIFNNLFMSIAEQMGAVLANTAYSVNIKERLDFSCAVFDADGNLIANAPHMPVHLGSMGESVQAVIRQDAAAMKPGNVYVLNAPYNGGTHLPDVTAITPVFDDEGDQVLFYVASRGHHADIGGITPGSMPPDSRTVEEEGVLIDNLLAVEEGRLREDALRRLLGGGKWPARNPDHNIGDLKAQIAANQKGVQELGRMVGHFGLDVVRAYMGHVQDNAEESVRRVLDVLTDGSFDHQMDDGARIRVAITVDKESRTATIDFTGTSEQRDNNFNAPATVCRAAVLYVFRTLIDDDIPLNAGCLKPIRIVNPEGCMLNPRYPAAVVAGNVETSQAVTDALYGALGVLASAQGTMNNFTFGNDRYQYYETICGGSGAGPDFDGTDAVHTHMTNSRLTDVEVLEWRFPVLIEAFRIRRGSGGAGRHRGGDGAVRRIRFGEAMTAAILSEHRRVPPHGLHGGEAGAVGINYVLRADGRRDALSGTDRAELAVGDVFVIETPGGGGFGSKGEET